MIKMSNYMTPKEKAVEIYERYYYSISDIPEYNLHERAIDCSLICVDMVKGLSNPCCQSDNLKYWGEVMEELNNLK